MAAAQAELDRLVHAFFAVFDNREGRAPRLDDFASLFVHHAVIARKTGEKLEMTTVPEFIAPRRALFDSGELVDFHEWETSARTTITGNLASRHSRYRKQGYLRGEVYQGEGEKCFQFVHVQSTWKIVAVTWEDAPSGYLAPAT